jgi:GTP-binding protein HflX
VRDIIDQNEPPKRALLVAVQTPDVTDLELHSSLAELRALGRTLGLEIVGELTQKLKHFDAGGYVGPGKREELKALIASKNADAILVDHEISPSQARNLEKEMEATVLDRTGVILEIFHRHARSRAAKAQVEIVRLRYLAPRLRDAAKGKGDRQRGGIGGKGTGESALELDRRKIRDRMAELATEISQMDHERQTQRARRSSTDGLERVALVGYTNAGKSTLMRALTGSEVYVADKLFATLDTTVRTLSPETTPRVLVSDTVGFIKNLPHGLVASFKSTLEEALEATLLCHVVDASDEGWERHRAVTDEVLGEIGAAEIPRLLVMNKIDRLSPEAIEDLRSRVPDAIFMSAVRPADVASLRQSIIDHFARHYVEATLFVPWEDGKRRGEIFASCQVLDEKVDEKGAHLTVRTHPALLDRFRT